MRADVAILRMRAAARQRSRRLRSRLGSCTKKRRDVPADGAPGRTFTSRPAPLPWQEAPSDREPRPTKGLSSLDRPPVATPPRPKAWPGIAEVLMAPVETRAMARPL